LQTRVQGVAQMDATPQTVEVQRTVRAAHSGSACRPHASEACLLDSAPPPTEGGHHGCTIALGQLPEERHLRFNVCNETTMRAIGLLVSGGTPLPREFPKERWRGFVCVATVVGWTDGSVGQNFDLAKMIDQGAWLVHACAAPAVAAQAVRGMSGRVAASAGPAAVAAAAAAAGGGAASSASTTTALADRTLPTRGAASEAPRWSPGAR